MGRAMAPIGTTLALFLSLCAPATNLFAQMKPPVTAPAFVHPGLLHTQADLDRMRQRVAAGQEPWKSGFEKLRGHEQSGADWKLRGPVAVVTREPGDVEGNAQMVLDGNAA
jgi:hypothetical protein